MRLRIVRKYGGSFVIRLSKEDMKDFNLKEFDYADINDITFYKTPNKCSSCKNEIEVEDLDLVNGKWLCKECDK